MLPVKEYFKRPQIIAIVLLQRFFTWLPDKLYLQLMFRLKMGKKIDLKDPKTFSEKLQWLKLYNRKPEYTMMVDKYAVKDYVADIIGNEYIIPTLGVWDRVEDIEWDKLPNQFVLKTTYGGGGGGVLICKDKSHFDKELAKQKLFQSMKGDIYRTLREWPYKNVPHRIIAEKYLEQKTKLANLNEKQKQINDENLNDYKFFCFDGKVKAMFIATDRFTKEGSQKNVKFDFFDENFNHLPFTQGHPNADIKPVKPPCFEQMKLIAEKLSAGLPHVRVDVYECDGKIYFGELTFFHFSGTMPFVPEKWDNIFGDWLNLKPLINCTDAGLLK